ncbi:hypothetical protein [Paenibacillus gorillae]|uniref:hypothetical protein n=1 Tax=Paenibacillus gorillae TaxID=1243662 RepID=UPI0005A911EB|nr:hypothetical protein [Paenibacillus gorillae]
MYMWANLLESKEYQDEYQSGVKGQGYHSTVKYLKTVNSVTKDHKGTLAHRLLLEGQSLMGRRLYPITYSELIYASIHDLLVKIWKSIINSSEVTIIAIWSESILVEVKPSFNLSSLLLQTIENDFPKGWEPPKFSLIKIE